MKAIYISDLPGDNGPVHLVVDMTDASNSKGTLKFLQTLTEGLIECVQLKRSVDMWVNEEGLFHPDFEINSSASRLAIRITGHPYVLRGPAVITRQVNGETVGFTDQQLDDFASEYGLRVNSESKVWTADEVQETQIALRQSTLSA
jgi:hypothetical protein